MTEEKLQEHRDKYDRLLKEFETASVEEAKIIKHSINNILTILNYYQDSTKGE